MLDFISNVLGVLDLIPSDTPRDQRRIFVIVLCVMVVVLIGIAVWAATRASAAG